MQAVQVPKSIGIMMTPGTNGYLVSLMRMDACESCTLRELLAFGLRQSDGEPSRQLRLQSFPFWPCRLDEKSWKRVCSGRSMDCS